MKEITQEQAKQFVQIGLDALREHVEIRNSSLFIDNPVYEQMHRAMTGWVAIAETVDAGRLTPSNLNALRCLVDVVYQKAYGQGKKAADREAALNHIYVKENENA